MDAMRKQSEMHGMSDINNTQLRGQVETRWATISQPAVHLSQILYYCPWPVLWNDLNLVTETL